MLNNFWYIACASIKLGNEPYGTQILGHRIAVLRDQNGRVHAFEDRCCHRGFPISKCAIEGNRIACKYHGWKFDFSGQCTSIPSQSADQKIPSHFRLKSYECIENCGYIWVWIGDQKSTAVPQIPNFQSQKWIQGSCEINCNWIRGLEITYDMAHIPFVHPQHPFTDFANEQLRFKKAVELRYTEDGCVVFCPATPSESDPVPKVSSKMQFFLPDRVSFEIYGGPHLEYIHFFVVPVSQKKCRMEWLLSNFNETSPPLIWDDNPKVIEEDKWVLEVVEENCDHFNTDFEKSVAEDIPTLAIRKIIQQAGLRSEQFLNAQKRIVFESFTPLSLPRELDL